MKCPPLFRILLFGILLPSPFAVNISFGAETSAALSILEAPSARPSSLAEAFSSVENDIAAFSYNPASLKSLSTGQASFLYKTGLFDESYAHIMVGTPQKNRGWGMSVGYFDSGEETLNDGTVQRRATLQKDLTLMGGTAFSWRKVNAGFALKYFSSELGELVNATAVAMDAGLQTHLSQDVTLGVAFLNIGTKVTYIEQSSDLPRQIRAGIGLHPLPKFTMLVDSVYSINEQQLQPLIGFEYSPGIIAMRAGYKSGSDLEHLTFGMGFILEKLSIDYAIGLVGDFEAHHLISVSTRFGNGTQDRLSKSLPPTATESSPSQSPQTEDKPNVPFIKEHPGNSNDFNLPSELVVPEAQK